MKKFWVRKSDADVANATPSIFFSVRSELKNANPLPSIRIRMRTSESIHTCFAVKREKKSYGTFAGGTKKQCASAAPRPNAEREIDREKQRRKKNSKNRCISNIYHRIYYPTNRRMSTMERTKQMPLARTRDRPPFRT